MRTPITLLLLLVTALAGTHSTASPSPLVRTRSTSAPSLVSPAHLSSLASAGDLTVSDLRCEYSSNPLGVDTPTPRLFWKLTSALRGQRQKAYQVLVASTAELLAQNQGDLWDSGKVKSDASIHIPYAGKPLRSSQQVFWKVRVWDKDGAVSPWSPPATWTMGLLQPTDWQAQWIGATALATPIRRTIGYHAAETRTETDIKWVQVDLGQPLPITAIQLQPMEHAGKKGFGFPLRFKVEVANEPGFTNATLIADHSGTDFPNPGVNPVRFAGLTASARFVRVTATKLGQFTAFYCFALCQLEVLSGEANVAKGARVSAKDSVEKDGWSQAALTDGLCSREPQPPQTLLLRREFIIKPGLRRAVIHLCGLGYYELTLNGRKVSDTLFPPGWTKYDKTCLYDTYDLTPLLRPGANALGLLLANGMYNVVGGRYTKFTGSFGPLKAIGQVRLEYADGTTEALLTDSTWRQTVGPITFACIYGGEDYDARLEPAGWNQPGFAAAKWAPALVVKGPGGYLQGLSCAAPPIRAFDILKPVQVTPLPPAPTLNSSQVTIYDLGQNASLMPRLSVHGPAGATVRIIPAELLRPDGSVDRGSCGGGAAYWQYTLAGTGQETWFPKFFYHGCRYLQVECRPPAAAPNSQLPIVDFLEGVVVHSASEPIGQFACSNPLFNRIRQLIRWAQRSNMMSVMTDCPHREKLSWLEEDHLNGPSLRYEFDLAQLFTKLMNDMADSQLDNGLVPDIAPEYVQFQGGFRDSPEWGSAYVLVPWQQYEFTGDRELLRRHFEGMKRYVAYLGSRATNHIVFHGLGDWYDIGPKPPGVAQLTPLALTATAFYYYDTWIVAQTAALLGHPEQARHYEQLAGQIRLAFNQRFFNPATGAYATGSQCANSLPLVMTLVEPAQRPGVLQALVRDVRDRGNALTAGDVGYRYLLRALAEGHRSDVIFDINNQSEKPGYGYQLNQGATSLTEAWDAGRRSSQNHFMLGQIMEWFYHDLAGIQTDPDGPGFKQIVIKPALVGDLTWVNASYHSIHGPITSRWQRDAKSLTLTVSIPANTTATVWVPTASAHSILEGSRPAKRSPQVRFLRLENGYALYQIGSGQYEFHSPLAL